MEKSSKKYEVLQEWLLDYIKNNNLKLNDKLPTIKEIIRDTKFSYATVNRTLIEMEKEKLISKIQGKGLFVNRISAKSNNDQIALIIPDHFCTHKIFLDILSGIRTVLEQANVGLLVSITNMSHEKEKETIENLISKKIDGLIIFLESHYNENYSHIVELKQKKFPFVLIDRYIPELETDYVVINNHDAMFRICSYLKYNKHCDKIILIPDFQSPLAISSTQEKIKGFKDAIKILFGSEATIINQDEFIISVDELSQSCNNLGLCINHDSMVLDINICLQDVGKEIPANCHVFGYNNSYETTRFPTVEQFNNIVGMKAAEILIEKMRNPNAPVKQIRVTPSLVLPDEKGSFYLEKNSVLPQLSI